MTAAGISSRVTEISPKAKARIIAVFYLGSIVLGGLGQATQDALVVPGDAATTAANVLAHTRDLWSGFGMFMVEMACSVVATALLYDLMKPVNKNLSLLAASFSLVGIIIKTMSRLYFIAPAFVLGGGDWLQAFTADQVRALALLCFKLNAQGAGMAMIFFGFYALISGYLIIRSTFLPTFLGVLGMIAGLGWLTFLHPPLGLQLIRPLTLLAVGAAFVKILWFLIKGVDEERWKEAATAARVSLWA